MEADEPLISPSAPGGALHLGPLSARGIRVVFKDLEYRLPSNVKRGTMATVLHHMSGYLNPGEMTAIMGPSGCGKTILMDVLSGRTMKGSVTGTIRYAGTQPTEMFLRRVTGYVAQFGTLLENLTTYEMLMYTAELKTPLSVSFEQKKKAVNDLISKLALDVCRDTKIGNPQLDRGISGGQAKRVNVGIALISNPRVLYMDEPTSGLDSYTSNEVMTIVKGLVADGITICASIHSPTPYVFNLFDSVLLLLRGQMVYFGKRSEASTYFEKTLIEDIHATTDAERITDVIVKADAADRVHELVDDYDNSIHKSKTNDFLESIVEDEALPEELTKELHIKQATVTPFWFAIKTLMKYRTVKNLLDPTFWGSRMADKVVLTLIFASVYFGIGDDLSFENFTNLAALFASWTGFVAGGAGVYIPFLHEGRVVFQRELRDGLYRVATYFFVSLIEEFVVIFVSSIVLSVAIYYTVDLQGSLLVINLAFVAMFLCGLGCALLVANTMPTVDAAIGTIAPYWMTIVMFNGFYIRLDDLPVYLRWYANIDFMQFSFGALLLNHYGSSEGGGNLKVTSGDRVGETHNVFEYFGYEGADAMEYVGYIYLFALGYLTLAYLGMAFLRSEAK